MKKWKLWTGMLLIFVAGGVVGAVGTGLVVRHKIISVIDEGQPAVARLAVRFLTRRLDLSAAQQAETARIVHDVQQRLQAVRRRFRPEIGEIVATGMTDIRALLAPGQQEKLDRLYNTLKQRWQPPRALPADREKRS